MLIFPYFGIQQPSVLAMCSSRSSVLSCPPPSSLPPPDNRHQILDQCHPIWKCPSSSWFTFLPGFHYTSDWLRTVLFHLSAITTYRDHAYKWLALTLVVGKISLNCFESSLKALEHSDVNSPKPVSEVFQDPFSEEFENRHIPFCTL